MKTASILLALVVVLCFVREAGATMLQIKKNYTVSLAGRDYGFRDLELLGRVGDLSWSEICLGPLGEHKVPFTATQGLVGFCLIVVALIALLATVTVRQQFTLRDLFWLTLAIAALLWFFRFLSGVDPDIFLVRLVWGCIPLGVIAWLWSFDRNRPQRNQNDVTPK